MKKNLLISAFQKHEREPMDLGIGANQPGQIVLANENRLTSAYFSEPLSAYAVGWKDPANTQEMLDFLFPPIQVNRRFEFKKHNNLEEFLSETDDVRSIGSDFKTVKYSGSSVNSKTLNKGLTVEIDLDDVSGTGWQEAATGRLMRRLARNDLRRAIVAIAAAAHDNAKTWDATAGKDPDQDTRTALTLGADGSGVRANRVVYGETAMDKRVLSHRAQVTAGGMSSAMATLQQIAAILGVDEVRVSKERYASSSTAKSQIVANLVLAFYAEDGLDKDDPSNCKAFWSPCEGGEKYRVYAQQISAKKFAITVEHYSQLVVTSTLGIEKLTIS